jgi:hypothetical protein
MYLNPGKHVAAYYPQVQQTLSNTLDEVNAASQHTVNYVLGRGGVRSIVISSLIFLTVYAWIDVFTQIYKDWVLAPASPQLEFEGESFIADPLAHAIRTNQARRHIQKPKGPGLNSIGLLSILLDNI